MSIQLYNRQFFASKQPVSKLNKWQLEQIGSWYLYIQQNLEFEIARDGENEVIILGLAIDVRKSTSYNESIAKKFLIHIDDWVNYYKYLSGTFVILFRRKGKTYVVTDCGAFRKIFYVTNQPTCIAPDPKLISECWDINLDKSDSAKAYFSSDTFKKKQKWIGSYTSFTDVRQLIPNHFLNLETLTVERFWPIEPREEKSLEEIEEPLLSFLNNQTEQLVNNYNVNLSLTAGWDSRIALLSCKEVIDKINGYTFYKPRFRKISSVDIKVAKTLCKIAGIKHKTITIPEGKKVNDALQNSFYLRREGIQTVIEYGFYTHFSWKDLTINGLMSEVAKSYFGKNKNYTTLYLSKSIGLNKFNYINNIINEWMKSDATEISRKGYNVGDFFHWEMNIIHEAGISRAMLDTVGYSHSPFNSIAVLELLLSLPTNLRDDYTHPAYRRLLKRSWPDIEKVPINPYARRKMIVFMKRLGIYNYYLYFKKSF